MLHTLVLIIHVVACLALIAIVLLQTGRGAEMGAAFGGSSQTLFGSSGGSTFLGKLTTAAAIIFMITCLGLTYFSSRSETTSVMEKVKVEEQQGPAIPDAKPVQGVPGATAPSPGTEAPAGQTPAEKAPAGATGGQTTMPPVTTVPTPVPPAPSADKPQQ